MASYYLSVSPAFADPALIVDNQPFSAKELLAYLSDPNNAYGQISITMQIYRCESDEVATFARLLDMICQQDIRNCNLTIYSEKMLFKNIIPVLSAKLTAGLPEGFELAISGTSMPRGLNIGDIKKIIGVIQASKGLPNYFGFKIESIELPFALTKKLTKLMKSGHLPKGSSIKLIYYASNNESLNQTTALFKDALTSKHTQERYHVDLHVRGEAVGNTDYLSQIGLTSIITEENLPKGFRIDIYISPVELDQVCDYIANIKTKQPIQLRLHGEVATADIGKLTQSLRNAALAAGSVINLAAIRPAHIIDGIRLFNELLVVNKNVIPLTIILPLNNLLAIPLAYPDPINWFDAYINIILKFFKESKLNPHITLIFDGNPHYANHFLTLNKTLNYDTYVRGTTLLCSGLLQYLPMLSDIRLPFLTLDAHQKYHAYKYLIALQKLSITITDTQLSLAVMRSEVERVTKIHHFYDTDGKSLIQSFLSDTDGNKQHILDVTALTPVKPLKLIAAQASLLILRSFYTSYTQTNSLADFQALLRMIPDDVAKILHDTQNLNSIVNPDVTASSIQPFTFFYDTPLENKRALAKEEERNDKAQKRFKR